MSKHNNTIKQNSMYFAAQDINEKYPTGYLFTESNKVFRKDPAEVPESLQQEIQEIINHLSFEESVDVGTMKGVQFSNSESGDECMIITVQSVEPVFIVFRKVHPLFIKQALLLAQGKDASNISLLYDTKLWKKDPLLEGLIGDLGKIVTIGKMIDQDWMELLVSYFCTQKYLHNPMEEIPESAKSMITQTYKS